MSVFNDKHQNQLLLAKGKGLLDSGSSFLAVPEEQRLGGSRLPVCCHDRPDRQLSPCLKLKDAQPSTTLHTP